MAKYHFYINGELADADQDGQDFLDRDAARDAAAQAFGEILRDDRILLRNGFFSLRLLDETGELIVELSAQATP